MKNYIAQYKIIFILSWIVLYVIYPTWISKHAVFQTRIPSLSDSFARSLVILGLIIYFSVSAYLLSRFFNKLTVNKPFIIKINGWSKHIKSNLWLVIICLLSLVLHIQTFSFVTILGELPFLERSFSMYGVLSKHWYRLFDFPIQYFFWSLIILLLLIKKEKKIVNSITKNISEKYSLFLSNNLLKGVFIFFVFVLLTIYSNLFPYYSYGESLRLIRYPPVFKFLYLINYFAFGLSHVGPRIMQFVFYILSAVYLYRAILLYKEKEVALFVTTIFMFSPIVFSYASQAALESGAVFLIVLVSFYFLRFIKEEDDRDLILATYFISIGFLYKRGLLVMFIVCFAFLFLNKLRKRDFSSLIHFKILMLALVAILPWLKIGPSIPPVWSHLTSLDGLSIVSLMLKSQISLIVFLLFIVSFVFVLAVKGNDLVLFFGLVFISYYLLFTIMKFGQWNHRYMMALYPSIAVFLALFLFGITQKIRWQHAFKLTALIFCIYLFFICLVPRSFSSLTTYRYKDFETQYLPVDKATDWIKNETEIDAKIFVLYMMPYKFYVENIYPDKKGIEQKIFVFGAPGYGIKETILPMQYFKKHCNEKKFSYIMFPFGPNNSYPLGRTLMEKMEMTKYLKENMDDYFKKVAEFHLQDNYIYIYKVND